MSADMILRAAIASRLRDLGPAAESVSVTVFNGVAMLNGDVDTREIYDSVLRTVRSILPVRHVVNGLRIVSDSLVASIAG
jgi:osmotically-inducible protein OsmY